MQAVWDTLKEKKRRKRKKQRPFGQERAKALCELHILSKKHRDILRCSPNKGIERYTVRA